MGGPKETDMAIVNLFLFAIVALLVVVAVAWVMRKLRGPKSEERLPR